jgi:hypothetical protein
MAYASPFLFCLILLLTACAGTTTGFTAQGLSMTQKF